MTQTISSKRSTQVLLLIRSIWHLVAVVAVTVWGFVAWPLPMPGVAFGVGGFLLAVLLWALFLSPKPVLRADRFAQSMIELLLIAAAVAALIEIGVPWFIAVAYGVAGAIIGYAVGIQKSLQA